MTQYLLLVDDDNDDRELFMECVNELGTAVKCFQARNGEEALRFLLENKVHMDYIFLDINMPVMGGIECFKRLRKIEAFLHIPVIIYSTSQFIGDLFSISEPGPLYFMTKPSRLYELRDSIANILKGNLYFPLLKQLIPA